MRAASEEMLLECGDGVVLQAFHASPAKRGREPGKRLAVLLHGWEGSADSTYVLSASQTLYDHWRAGTNLDALDAWLRPPDRVEAYAIQAAIESEVTSQEWGSGSARRSQADGASTLSRPGRSSRRLRTSAAPGASRASR